MLCQCKIINATPSADISYSTALAGSYSVDISCHGSSMLRPWFIALVAAGAIERLAGLALGVSMERDWVVLVRYKSSLLSC
jgi:hypothetical protein